MLHLERYKKNHGTRSKRRYLLFICAFLLITISIIVCIKKKGKEQDSDKVIGISCPIKGLRFGMTLEECKQNLGKVTLTTVDEGYMTYLLSDKMKVLGYEADVLLYFTPKSDYDWMPLQSDGLSAVQLNYEDVDIDQIKKNISTLIGTPSQEWVELNKDIVTRWKSIDTIASLDEQKQKALYDYWNLLQEHSNNEFIKYQRDSTEPISYISLRDPGNNNCSVRFTSNMLYLLEKLGAMKDN